MSRGMFICFGVVLMALGGWGMHVEPKGWLAWLALGSILAGGLITFVANIPGQRDAG